MYTTSTVVGDDTFDSMAMGGEGLATGTGMTWVFLGGDVFELLTLGGEESLPGRRAT